jgi:HEAT repeat protein
MPRTIRRGAWLLGLLVAADITAQGPPPRPSPANEVAAAREMAAEGRIAEALERIDTVLARDPANRDAVVLKVTTLLGARRFGDALASYDAFASALNRPDAALLSVIAQADLASLAEKPPDEGLEAAALERLARAGDSRAGDRLRRLAASAQAPGLVTLLNVSLARLGDHEASRRLGAMLQRASTAEERTRAILALRDVGARGEASKVAALLDDGDVRVRGAAAATVGVLGFADAAPRLETLFTEDEHVVRMRAAVALKLLGRKTADAYLDQLLKNGAPEVRLIAAEGYQATKNAQWTSPIRSILSDRQEVNRLRAAEVLACCDPAAALAALAAMMRSENPFVRIDAARILEAKGLADHAMARRMLGDAVAAVRVHGAGVAITLASAPAVEKKPPAPTRR